MSELLSPKIELFADFMHGFYCPGCKWMHHIAITKPSETNQQWQWDGNVNMPTYSPSISVEWSRYDVPIKCHSFIQNGQWVFLGDCTHELAGQTVSMVDIPEEQL